MKWPIVFPHWVLTKLQCSLGTRLMKWPIVSSLGADQVAVEPGNEAYEVAYCFPPLGADQVAVEPGNDAYEVAFCFPTGC